MPGANIAELEEQLLRLAHELGREDRRLVLLREGSVSTRVSAATCLVKAGGASLGTLSPLGVVECRFSRLLALLEEKAPTEAAIEGALLASRTDPAAKKPSLEAPFHAWLLTLPGVNFVGHTHPVAVNQVLCSRHARRFARSRLSPDEVASCGSESAFVPYTEPGVRLGQAIRAAVMAYRQRRSRLPRVILLEKHGLVALGPSADSVLTATLMTAKAAEIFAGAAALNRGRPDGLTAAQVARIAGRANEQPGRSAWG